jgi:hypothetical protein
MNTANFKTRLPFLALVLCGTFAAVPVWAAPTTDPAELAQLAARNRQERADCLSVQEAGARADCVRDANVAYGHQKRNRATDIDPPFAKNVTRRCDALSGDENRDCLARMDGQGKTSGSVEDGGIYRELVVFETMAAPTPPAAPGAAIAPMTPVAPMTMPMAPTAPMATPMATPMAPMSTPVIPAAPAAKTLPSATNPTTPK